MITSLVLFLFGYLGHQTKRYTRELQPGFASLTEHVIGALMIFAACQYYKKVTKNESDVEIFFAAVTPMGLGVAAGYALEDAE